MSKMFRVKTERGLFVPLRYAPLASLAAIEGFKQKVLPGLDAAQAARAEKLIEILDAMPTGESYMSLSPYDPGFDRAKAEAFEAAKSMGQPTYPHRQSGKLACRGWWMPGTARSSSVHSEQPVGDAKSAGWHRIAAFADAADELNVLFSKAGMPIIESSIAGAKASSKRAKLLVFEAVEAAQEMSSSSAWALYLSGANGGFMDDKGSRGPLARARLYESAVAAARSASSKSLRSWKVVRASVEIQSLEDFPGDQGDDRLMSAVALREGAMLEEALEKIGIERVRAKLAELEAKGVAAEAGRTKSRL